MASRVERLALCRGVKLFPDPAGEISRHGIAGPKRVCVRFPLDFFMHLPHPVSMSDVNALIAANAAFYSAFAMRDVEAMARLWAEDDAVSCIHPGWPAIVGRNAVIGSWRDILEGGRSPLITCHEPYAIVTGDEGRVLCIEMIGTLALAASNHFRRIGGAWRLVHHQSSPIAQAGDHAQKSDTLHSSHIH